ncbi:MAG: hypothetical protein TREMPRED_001612 [Tremellales sp. Tagirdzhanova-0007]|nr:MAG: hypothetical protein TREMPRED_001612 [Tremellales sp. Tagirdzhanova-0007]
MSRLVAEVSQSISNKLAGESAEDIAELFQSLYDDDQIDVANWILRGWNESMREELSKGKLSSGEICDNRKKVMDVLALLESQKFSLQTSVQSDKSSDHNVTISGRKLSGFSAMSDERITDYLACLCKSGQSVLADDFLESLHLLWSDNLRANIRADPSDPGVQECIDRYEALGERRKHLSDQKFAATSDRV